MEIQTVSCMVGIRTHPEEDTFTAEIYRTGVDAVPVTEIPVFQAMNGLESVTMVAPYGSYETTKKAELDRIRRKFKPDYVGVVYPSDGIPIPRTINDVQLEAHQMAPKAKAPPKVTEDA